MNVRLLKITSIAQLRAMAAAWDDLWQRSEVTIPTSRAELLAQWIEQFAPRSAFYGLVVERGGQFVAALPLVGTKIGRVIWAGGMPSNHWSPSGELLLDPSADVDSVLDLLVSGIAQLPWQLLWLDAVISDARRWQLLSDALNRAGMSLESNERFTVGTVETTGDWKAYQASWSKNHRRKISRCTSRLAQDGAVEVRLLRDVPPADVEPLLRRGFEVEDRSWKGEHGTSVLRSPEMFAFYVRQARQLAQWNQLQLCFLNFNGQSIAFEYGWHAKGIYHCYKVGYDQQHAAYSPGYVLRYHVLEELFANPAGRGLDFMGPLTDATGKWITGSYRIGRLVIAPRKPLGRALLYAYKDWWPAVRRLRDRRRRQLSNGCGLVSDQPTTKAPAATERVANL